MEAAFLRNLARMAEWHNLVRKKPTQGWSVIFVGIQESVYLSFSKFWHTGIAIPRLPSLSEAIFA
jgi:hypothetical protein